MAGKPRSKPALFFAAAYLLLAVASLAFIFVSGDSLAGVFAVLVIQPWGSWLVWVMDIAGMDSFFFNLLFMSGGALLNSWVIYKVVAWLVARLASISRSRL
jgi:hypothetical protein